MSKATQLYVSPEINGDDREEYNLCEKCTERRLVEDGFVEGKPFDGDIYDAKPNTMCEDCLEVLETVYLLEDREDGGEWQLASDAEPIANPEFARELARKWVAESEDPDTYRVRVAVYTRTGEL